MGCFVLNKEGVNLAEELKNLANEIKDKWINIRCTEQERQDITEQAKANNMSVAEFFRYLVAKEREEQKMVKVVVVEETREVYVYIDGKEIKIDELEYIPTGFCED